MIDIEPAWNIYTSNPDYVAMSKRAFAEVIASYEKARAPQDEVEAVKLSITQGTNVIYTEDLPLKAGDDLFVFWENFDNRVIAFRGKVDANGILHAVYKRNFGYSDEMISRSANITPQ